jgi:hypothetical protein
MTAPAPVPVICDRCRAEGLGGAVPFLDLGDLLEFEPVPRRPRANGWTPEVQRHFIAALAVTGSDRQAAHAVGKAQFGVDQLKKAKGNEGFLAAHARALAMAADDKSRRLAAGLHAVTAPAALWRPPEPAWSKAESRQILPGTGRGTARSVVEGAPSPDELDDLDDDARLAAAGPKLKALDAFHRHYLQRLDMEREARLAGRIVEADFYVRQITYMEVMLDLLSGDGWRWLDRQRFQGKDHHRFIPIDPAETWFSRILDETRRDYWAESGEPERPPLPPPEQLVDHGRFKTGASDCVHGGPDWREQERAMEERHKEAAREQVRWEAEARRDYERRRDSDAANNQEPGPAGQPAPEGRQD